MMIGAHTQNVDFQAAYSQEPEATVGTETDRAFESACECSKLVHEIAVRVLGPDPALVGSASQPDDSLRGRIRKVANVNGDTACTLRSILQAL